VIVASHVAKVGKAYAREQQSAVSWRVKPVESGAVVGTRPKVPLLLLTALSRNQSSDSRIPRNASESLSATTGRYVTVTDLFAKQIRTCSDLPRGEHDASRLFSTSPYPSYNVPAPAASSQKAIMALSKTLQPSFSPDELTFLAEEEVIDIVPLFSMTRVRLLSVSSS